MVLIIQTIACCLAFRALAFFLITDMIVKDLYVMLVHISGYFLRQKFLKVRLLG